VIQEATRRSRSWPLRAPSRWTTTVLRWTGTRVRKSLGSALILGLPFILMREFGGPEVNQVFDRFVARLLRTIGALFTAIW
jgi:hypothetical protein